MLQNMSSAAVVIGALSLITSAAIQIHSKIQ